MAFAPESYASTFESLKANDYAVTPLEETIVLVEDTFEAPEVDDLAFQEVMKATSSGLARHAILKLGKAGGLTGSFTGIVGDLKNDTDGVTGPSGNWPSLMRGLATDTLSSTGYTTWTTTNQLVGKGAPMIKLLYTVTNDVGAATVYTYPVVITKVTPVKVQKAKAYKVDFMVAGTISRA